MLMYVLILCFSMGISALVFKVINDDYVEGQIGEATVQTVHPYSSAEFIARGGRIPAPLHSLKN